MLVPPPLIFIPFARRILSNFVMCALGHVTAAGGEELYMLCGELLPAQEGGRAGWMPFATIKTSDYEQWIGAQAAVFCRDSPVACDKAGDLSSSLKSRLDSLR
jgi:hypothetical protein